MMRWVEKRRPVLHFIQAWSSKTHRGESEAIYHKEKHNGWKHCQWKSLFILDTTTIWNMDVCVHQCVYMHAGFVVHTQHIYFCFMHT